MATKISSLFVKCPHARTTIAATRRKSLHWRLHFNIQLLTPLLIMLFVMFTVVAMLMTELPWPRITACCFAVRVSHKRTVRSLPPIQSTNVFFFKKTIKTLLQKTKIELYRWQSNRHCTHNQPIKHSLNGLVTHVIVSAPARPTDATSSRVSRRATIFRLRVVSWFE